MKDGIFHVLQRIGQSFMLPIALLPAAGILLGIGGALTNPATMAAYHLEAVLAPGTAAYSLLYIMSQAGGIVFSNLPIMFAMGVAIGMANREKEVAALSAVIAFFVMHASIGAMLELSGTNMADGATASVCGIKSLQLGVFGGIIVGCGTAALHNKYYNVQFPPMLSFFGGTRFIPIISSFVFLIVGILLVYIWPPIQTVITSASGLITRSGYWGTFIYGVIERALIPFGLHHVFYMPLWQTALGGTMEVGGKIIAGAQNIFFAQLQTPGIKHFSVEATRFMTGKFPFMIFGLPGAALAMYKTAKPEKRSIVRGLFVSAALTSMITGITEPIEFTFLFVAPVLYYLHCLLAGLSFALMHIMNVCVGMTFSGGLIDLFLFGIMQGNDKTNWIGIVFVGAIYFFVYYFIFSFAIKHWDLKTPGRGDEKEVKLYTKADVLAKNQKNDEVTDSISEAICNGLGGKKNIAAMDCCITRLRCSVHKPELVDAELLKQTGASGIICKGCGIQIIYGPKVANIKTKFEEYLLTAPDTEYHAEPAKTESSAQKYELPANIYFLKQDGQVKKGEAIMILKPQNTAFMHTIQDPLGIHARPAAAIAQLAKRFDCTITVSCNGNTANATSILEMMRLGATQGTTLQISAEGHDAISAVYALKKIMREKM